MAKQKDCKGLFCFFFARGGYLAKNDIAISPYTPYQ